MNLRLRNAFAAACVAAAVAGCASADKNQSQTTAKQSNAGMNMSGGSAGGMAGMNMPEGSSQGTAEMNQGSSSAETKVPKVNGVSPVPIKTIASTYWQDMEIQAQTMTPTPFVVFNGTTEEKVPVPKGSSFHLMIMLTDRHTHYQIPYCTVWATLINSMGKQVWSERQWPMISEYMGSHYGNNVPHLAPGRYTLKLLISPPEQGRHLEYSHMWLHQHQVVTHFTWKPTT